MLEQVAPHQPFAKRLVLANLWLFEPLIVRQLEGKPETNALLRTTMAPTLLSAGVKENVLPATASATLNFRLAPGETRDSLRAYLEKALPDSISVTSRGPSCPTLPRSPGFPLAPLIAWRRWRGRYRNSRWSRPTC